MERKFLQGFSPDVRTALPSRCDIVLYKVLRDLELVTKYDILSAYLCTDELVI